MMLQGILLNYFVSFGPSKLLKKDLCAFLVKICPFLTLLVWYCTHALHI